MRLLSSANLARAFMIGLVATTLCACAIKRSGYDVPNMPLPTQYRNVSTQLPAATASNAGNTPSSAVASDTAQDIGLAEWWRTFDNSELVELVDRGLANNQDVRIATLRMAQAKARADQARAGTLPVVNAPMGAAVQSSGAALGSVPLGSQDRTTQRTFQSSLQGSWRVDLWGERSSMAESAKFQLWQAAFERDNVQRNMVAGLASSYVEFLSLNDRLRVARETEAVLSNMLATIEKRVEAGDATMVDLDQQKASIFSARAVIPGLEQQRDDTLTSIAFLVGTVPGSLKLSRDGLNALQLPATVPALPSSLLFRRPDVRMAEARLLAADADVDVARARILPTLDLSSQAGFSSAALAQLFQPSTLFWNALGNLTSSIFDGGKLASEKANAQSVHEEMVETYARTIHQAVKEVETALVAIRTAGLRLVDQKKVIVSARRAWDSNAEMYAVGGVDYMSLLDAERTYQRYLDEFQRIRTDHYRGYINLFQAVGGGVNVVEPLPGKGARPTVAAADAIGSNAGRVSTAAPKAGAASGGVDWSARSVADEVRASAGETYWQVELPGLYHRSTIDATWRDLRARYPNITESRVLVPRLQGRVEGNIDGEMSWYRVYVRKFSTPEAAHELCAALQANFQRCRVISSRSEESVDAPPLSKNETGTAATHSLVRSSSN